MPPALCFHGDLVLPDRVMRNGYLLCEKGRIAEITSRMPRHVEILEAVYVSPGFIDLHVHGGEGADYMDGTADAVRVANRAHLKRGTTTIFPTTTTGSTEELARMLTACSAVRKSWTIADGARIAGVHYY